MAARGGVSLRIWVKIPVERGVPRMGITASPSGHAQLLGFAPPTLAWTGGWRRAPAGIFSCARELVLEDLC